MPILDLSDNERRVMLSIMRNPEHSDTDMARSIGMNLYTFNKVKNGLNRKNLMIRTVVPNYSLTGFELMVVTFGRNIDTFLDPTSIKDLVGSIHMDIPTRFLFTLVEQHQGIGIHAVEDYTSLKRGLQMKNTIINALGIHVGQMTHSLFSFRDADFKRFFDLIPMIERIYGEDLIIPNLEPENPAQRMCTMPWSDFFHQTREDDSDLDDISSQVLLKMVKYPDISDKAISNDLNLSRYKVRKIKDDLFRRGYAKTLIIPNYYELGFKVIMFMHFKIKKIKEVRKFLSPVKAGGNPRIIFLVLDEMEGAGMGIFPDLEEATKMYQKINIMIDDQEAIEDNPTIQMISLPNCDIKSPFFFSKPLEHKGSWDLDIKSIDKAL